MTEAEARYREIGAEPAKEAVARKPRQARKADASVPAK
jgi:hypothetical protein